MPRWCSLCRRHLVGRNSSEPLALTDWHPNHRSSMSYDLMFSAGNGKKLDKKAFKAYFRDRRNYQLGEGQAIYQNEDTGVYFIFDEPDNGVVAFNLNYFRPHIFGLEAAPELEQFAEAFAAIVTDPQGEIEDPGTFRREPFLRGW